MKNKSPLRHESRRGTAYLRKPDSEWRIKRLNEKLELRLAERTAQVQQKTRQLRAVARQLTLVERHERRRLAGILHDHIQQLLLSARAHLSLVNRDHLAAAQRNALNRADKIMCQAMGDCRSLAVDLSAPNRHEAGLGADLEWLARRMANLHGFKVELRLDTRAEPRSADMRVFLFEATRELLLNACKHSGCRSARVRMSREARRWLRITVEDAGKGFDPCALFIERASGERFGLASIRARLALLGARMELESAPGVGTRIDILAPTVRGRISRCEPNRQTAPAAGPNAATEGAIRLPASDKRRSNTRLMPAPV
jgi:signal transduction histidine kinase